MEDSRILDLYWERNEAAIEHTAKKYGNYCFRISWQILGDREDAAECVNETWLGLWNSIPPHRPENLAAYLGKLTRRISLKRWRDSRTEKRGGGQVELALEELSECVPGEPGLDAGLEAKELTRCIGTFLRTLPRTERQIFVLRYWYLEPVREIGRSFGFSESKVKSMLFRTRAKLKTELIKEGYYEER